MCFNCGRDSDGEEYCSTQCYYEYERYADEVFDDDAPTPYLNGVSRDA